MLEFIGGTVFGLIIGGGISFFLWKFSINQKNQYLNDIKTASNIEHEHIKNTFNTLSLEALSRNREEFLKLAKEQMSHQQELSGKELEGKKSLIDQTLKSMKDELGKVNHVVQELEKDRQAKFGVLTHEITKTAKETQILRETTGELKNALSHSRIRGQWGERMAEDVLRLAGFIENVNYTKQGTITDGDRSRPDYTFFLPDNHIVHMDVKFPLENYMSYMSADNETEKEAFRTQFLRDAKMRIEEVTKRGYVDPAGGTLDYVMVFIPNEQVYAFLNEQDRTLLDNALQKKIVLCSPTTLYAVLAVIHQAVDNFHMERKAGEILQLLASFSKQWDMFADSMDKMGRHIESTQTEFNKLVTTRKNALQRQLDKVHALKESDTHLKLEQPQLEQPQLKESSTPHLSVAASVDPVSKQARKKR